MHRARVKGKEYSESERKNKAMHMQMNKERVCMPTGLSRD